MGMVNMLANFFKKLGYVTVGLPTLYVVVCVLSGCAVYSEADRPINAVPTGSKVQFEKVMNTGFAEQYIEADIITEAEFLSSSFPKHRFEKGDIPKGYFAFQVLAPSGIPRPSNELSPTAMGNIVVVPKNYSDLIFSLKPGDLIELKGGTVVKKYSMLLKISTYGMSGDGTYVIFKATDLRKMD
jgi:hypothetical protein